LLGVELLSVRRSQHTNLQKGIAVMRIRVAIASMLLFALGSSAALAHAHLDHASPAVGGTVATAPTEVALFYTQNLEPAFSTVEVTDASGAGVDRGKPQISDNTMRVALKTLSPGTYNVHWHAVSVDTHTTQGAFSFTVGGK
jgi:copper resistance protein C